MWHIENPQKIFSYLNKVDSNSTFQLICLMKTEKYNSFPIADKETIQNISRDNFSFEDIQIKNPNNPVQLMDCKLITFKIQ